ncbi:hypothetical protein BGY98DRAFT_409400 [Russula aff. rugulosa BPL654]|nr:hypothetical protein BGY98DRAFT_409400 [Russula aff. rugulosa BPL654]
MQPTGYGVAYKPPHHLTMVCFVLQSTTPYQEVGIPVMAFIAPLFITGCHALHASRPPTDCSPVKRRTIYRLFQGSSMCFFGLKVIPFPTAGALFGKISVSTR